MHSNRSFHESWKHTADVTMRVCRLRWYTDLWKQQTLKVGLSYNWSSWAKFRSYERNHNLLEVRSSMLVISLSIRSVKSTPFLSSDYIKWVKSECRHLGSQNRTTPKFDIVKLEERGIPRLEVPKSWKFHGGLHWGIPEIRHWQKIEDIEQFFFRSL